MRVRVGGLGGGRRRCQQQYRDTFCDQVLLDPFAPPFSAPPPMHARLTMWSPRVQVAPGAVNQACEAAGEEVRPQPEEVAVRAGRRPRRRRSVAGEGGRRPQGRAACQGVGEKLRKPVSAWGQGWMQACSRQRAGLGAPTAVGGGRQESRTTNWGGRAVSPSGAAVAPGRLHEELKARGGLGEGARGPAGRP